MTQTKHTESPWETKKEDARLIAATPELLEACKEAYRYLDDKSVLTEDQEAVLEKLRSAIIKSEGSV
jgi:hypothetical protein